MATCCLCLGSDWCCRMTTLQWDRFRVLRYLFDGVKQPEDWAHPHCLEKLGLHPIPAEPQPNLWENMRMAFVDHMYHLMQGNRDIQDHETLIKVLHIQILGDHPLASKLAVVALHKLVARSVVMLLVLDFTRRTEGTIRKLIEREEAIDWGIFVMQRDHQHRMAGIQRKGMLQNMQGTEHKQRKELHHQEVVDRRALRSQMLMDRRNRIQLETGPCTYLGRYSVSHWILRMLRAHGPHLPPLYATFHAVAEWFRHQRHDVRYVCKYGATIVFAWQRQHAHAFTQKHQLWVHIHKHFFPDEPAPEPPRHGIERFFIK